MAEASRTAILGAGALGLTVALRLAQRGEAVTVYERQPLAGGLAAGFELEPGIWLDRFYHHAFRSDRHLVGLIDELGLTERLTWHRPVTATLRDGKVHQLDSPRSLLRFSPLPIPDRLRMGATLGFLRALPSPERLEGKTAASWLSRTMGQRAYRVVWEPLLRGKFGDAADEIAMPWLWARIHDRTAELGYLNGGFQALYDALARRIIALGGDLRLSTAVDAVEPVDEAIEVRAGANAVRFDRVVSTLPTRLTASLTPALPPEWRARHEWGRAYAAHCLILALDQPLTGVYWLNVTDPGFPFMALVEHTNMRSPAEYGGRHIVYLGSYWPMDDPRLGLSHAEMLERCLPALARLNPSFDRGWVTGSWSFTAPYAQPIVTTEYRDHIPPFVTPIPGLYIANMFQVYPHDRGQNYSIALADRLVGSALAGDARSGSARRGRNSSVSSNR